MTAHADGHADIAYVTFAPFQRRGYAHDPALTGIGTFVDTRNAASIALMRSLGATILETIRDADHFGGATSDEYRFALAGVGTRVLLPLLPGEGWGEGPGMHRL